MEKNQRICIVDDDTESSTAIGDLCNEMGLPAETYHSPQEALDNIKSCPQYYSLLICDYFMPELNGPQLIQQTLNIHSDLPIILITAYNSTEIAISALQAGAFDYITKPINFTELSLTITRALKIYEIKQDYARIQRQLQLSSSLAWNISDPCAARFFIGKGPAIVEVAHLVDRVSNSMASVLITGETGTGKELVVQALHHCSDRKDGPLVSINCASIPENLLESELFGHDKGAFTGADKKREGLFLQAQGGSIFLDEIGDMPENLQAKLLRVLQDKKVRPLGQSKEIEVDVRFISATHKDLLSLVGEEKFRMDLFFRLNVVHIFVPPLRERKEDIPLLCDYFIKKFNQIHKPPRPITGLTHAALLKLLFYDWPGNIRELESTIERALIMSTGPLLQKENILLTIDCYGPKFKEEHFHLYPSLAQLEKDYLNFVMEATQGKREQAAEILGINRKTLYRKLKEYNGQRFIS